MSIQDEANSRGTVCSGFTDLFLAETIGPGSDGCPKQSNDTYHCSFIRETPEPDMLPAPATPATQTRTQGPFTLMRHAWRSFAHQPTSGRG